MKYKMISVLFAKRLTNGIRNEIRRAYSSEPKPFSSIPGLKALPIIGPLHHFLPVIGAIGPSGNFVELQAKMNEKFGSIAKMEGIFSRANMVFVYEPELYEPVYRSEESNPMRPGFETFVYYRDELRNSRYQDVHGLTTAQGEQWRDFRTKVNPALLKPKIIKLYSDQLDEIASDMMDNIIKLQDKGDYLKDKWYDEISKWSLESVALIGLGTRLGCLRDDLPDDHPAAQLTRIPKEILDLSFKLELFPTIWKRFNLKSFKRLVAAYDLQWKISKNYIEEARRKIEKHGEDVPEEDKSVLERLLAIDETVAIMMANEMLLAGIETVSFGTTALLYQLAKNPEAQEKARQEILSDAPQKRYLRACLKESLRKTPVVTAHLRRTTKDHVIAGYHIPKGVEVIAPNEYLSNIDRNYPRAKEFLPERWLVEKDDPLYYGNTHPMVTMPFGFGIRTCIGRRIAELEIETMVKAVLTRSKITWDGPPIKIKTTVMNSFSKPYYFKFELLK